MSEHDHQATLQTLLTWASLAAGQTKELRLLYEVQNIGLRHPTIKPPRFKSGLPGVCLPIPRGGFTALYIELESKGKRSRNQEWWLDEIAKWGNRTATCLSWEDARDEIERYLSMGKVRSMAVDIPNPSRVEKIIGATAFERSINA